MLTAKTQIPRPAKDYIKFGAAEGVGPHDLFGHQDFKSCVHAISPPRLNICSYIIDYREYIY